VHRVVEGDGLELGLGFLITWAGFRWGWLGGGEYGFEDGVFDGLECCVVVAGLE
jgi:hypothetical protein